MFKHTFLVFLLCNVVFAESIQQIIQKALRENPQLKAIQYQLKAYKEKQDYISSLPDPVFSFSIKDIQLFYKPLFRTLEPMQTINVSLSQKIPWLRKLKLKKQIVKKLYDEKFYTLQSKKQEILYNIYRYAFKYWQINEKLKIVKEYKEVAQHLIDFSNTLYSVGKVSQTDVFNSQVFYSKLLEEEKRLLESKKAILAKLAYYTTFKVKSVDVKPETPYKLQNLEAIKNKALNNNPQIKVFEEKVKEKKKELELAKLGHKPDFKVFSTYSYRQQFRDYVSVGVSFNIPKKEVYDKKVLEAANLKVSQEKIYLDVVNKILSEIEDTYHLANSYYDSYKIFNQFLLFQSQKVYESVISEYEVGKKNIFDVLKSLNQILDVKMRLVDTTAEFNISYKKLQKLAGELQ